MKRLLLPLALVALCGCSAREIQAWLAWHAVDPDAAVAHLDQLDEAVEPAVTWTLDWDDVAWCESGGNWNHPPVTNRHGTFSGGLMWNHRYWDANGGERYADQPWQATKAEQIAVSEDFIDGSMARADDAWQCIP